MPEYPEFTVAEVRFHHHPALSIADDEGVLGPLPLAVPADPEIVVLIDGEWVPAGCETWSCPAAELARRAEVTILAAPRSYYTEENDVNAG